MDKEDLQRNFEGYLNTPLLWHDTKVYNLQQCVLEPSLQPLFTDGVTDHVRLGKLVERFVLHQLAASTSWEILIANVQIKDQKRTIGEMDTILLSDNGPVHLEIIYKFYLYDSQEGHGELSHWIGPNRKDSLLQKLDKLKNKQLPLLYHLKSKPLLDTLNIKTEEIQQQVLFKAQLFLPFNYSKHVFIKLNPECVQGFYIKWDELDQFKSSQFYIPEKINWLMAVDKDVNWLSFDTFTMEVRSWLDRERSPLCWLKDDDGMRKFFVVWW